MKAPVRFKLTTCGFVGDALNYYASLLGNMYEKEKNVLKLYLILYFN